MSKIINLLEGQTGKIVYRPTFRNTPIPNEVTIDKDNSVLKDAINLGECKANEDGVTGEVPFTAKAKAKSDLQIVFARKDVNGNVEGKDISTQDLTVDIGASELIIVTAEPNKVKHSSDNTYKINMSLKNGDQTVSLKDPTLVNTSSDTFTIVGTDENSFSVKMNESKINKDPAVFSTNFNFNLNLYSSSISHTLNVCWEPVIQAEKLITSIVYGDKGTMPIKITNGKGEDITSSITNLVCTSEYLKFDAQGSWEVIKEITNDITHEVTFKFDVTQEGYTWPMTLKVSFNLLAKPKSIKASLLSEGSIISLSNGNMKFKMVYDTGEIVTDATYVSRTNNSPSTSFSNFGSGFKASNSANGEYEVSYTSGYKYGSSSCTVTVKTKYGEYVVTLPSITCRDQPFSVTASPVVLDKGAKNSKFIFTAKQQRSIGGTPVELTGNLELIWLRGANIVSAPSGSGPWTVYLADDGIGNTVEMNFNLGSLSGTGSIYKA
ncbi:hypothetical protein YUBABA_00790 [Serratia phage vB_SmaM-Yubaba]|nr:hypothetical protein YUBABA_00790 [Serratia phage vB_SmaM-Yubaba]